MIKSHEEKMMLLETTQHDSKYFGPMHGSPLYKLKIDINLQHDALSDHHKIENLVEHAKASRAFGPYTRSSFDINRTLIGNRTPILAKLVYKHQAKAISEAIKKHGKPLENEVHAYSGTGHFNPGSALQHGGILHTPAFTSASIHPAITYNFMNEDGRDSHVIHFHLPKGYNKSYYIGHQTTHHENEYEILLDKGQKWKLTGHEIVHNPNNPISHTVHIWSVKPHDEHLTEMTYHDHELVTKIISTTPNKHGQAIELNRPNKTKDVENQHERLEQHTDNLTDSHINAIEKYTDNSSRLNISLIKGREFSGRLKRVHDHLQDAFANSKGLPETTHVYSGLGSWNPSSHFKNGTVHTPAYTSASLDPEYAHMFAHSENNEAHMMHFELPKGHKDSLFVGHVSWAPAEHEVILNHNQHWDLTGHHVIDRPNKFTGETTKVHVWSVKPSEKHINESYFHSKHFFSGEIYRFRSNHFTKANTKRKNLLTAKAESVNNHYYNLIDAEVPADKLPEAHLNAARYYARSTGARAINTHLIAQSVGKPSLSHEQRDVHIHNLQEYVHAGPKLEHDGHFYSGTGHWDPDVQVGGILHTPAFTSTSSDPDISKSFTIKTIIHFHLPKGYNKGRSIAKHDHVSEAEREYLLAPDQKWRVTNVQHVRKYGLGSTAKHKIISVVPHEDEHLTETYFHSKHFFSERRIYKAKIGAKPEVRRSLESKISNNANARSLLKDDMNKSVKQHSSDLKRDESDDIPVHHWEAARHYSSSAGSSSINHHLIDVHSGLPNYKDETRDRHIENLKDYIKSGPSLSQEGHFYSGTGNWAPKVEVGGTLHTPAFTSTSAEPNIARDFAANTIIHFHLPKGYNKGRNIASHTPISNSEREYLLEPNQKWKVTNIQSVRKYKYRSASGGHARFKIISVVPHEEPEAPINKPKSKRWGLF